MVGNDNNYALCLEERMTTKCKAFVRSILEIRLYKSHIRGLPQEFLTKFIHIVLPQLSLYPYNIPFN